MLYFYIRFFHVNRAWMLLVRIVLLPMGVGSVGQGAPCLPLLDFDTWYRYSR